MNQSNTVSKIRVLQHNVAKSTNSMITCLEHALNNKIDVILMQESGIGSNEISVSHPAFNRITLNTSVELNNENKWPRTMTFVSKTSRFTITPRPDISNDSDIQVLSITGTDIDNFLIFNVYNEKNQLSISNEYIIERSLINIELSSNSIVCGEFNAHHAWGNSRISSIRANSLINGLNKFKCELINIPDEITFSRQSRTENDEIRTSTSVIDLIFATPRMAKKIIDGAINENACTGSDHEVIEFSITISNIETHDNLMNGALNVDKADWEKFEKYLKSQYDSNINSMQQFIDNPTSINLEKGAILLQNVIYDAANHSIFKRKSCEKSKK